MRGHNLSRGRSRSGPGATLSAAVALWLAAGAVHAQEQQQPAEPGPEPAAAEPAPAAEAAIEPEPDSLLESGDYTQPKSRRQCSTQDVLSGLCTSEEAALAAAKKSWRLLGRIELVMPVILDQTPENEVLMYYYLGGEVDLPFIVPGLYAVAWIGLVQNFWRIAGNSPVDFEDPLLAVGYRHSVPIGSGAKDLTVVHRFGAYFPASRPSRHNLYYTTLDWQTAARYPFEIEDIGSFSVGANIWSQLAFREYSTQTGEGIGATFDAPGGANTVFRLEGGGVLQYTIFDDVRAGSLLADVSAGYRHRFRYDGSSEPDWYWSLGATYTPISYLSIGLAMEHGYSDTMRGGVAHWVWFDRDETVWRVALYGRY